MKKFLLAGAAALALWSPANAAPKIVNDIPRSMQGAWCYSRSRDAARVNTSIYVKGKCEQGENTTDGDVTLSSMRFNGRELECNVSRIREIIRDKSYTLEMKCVGEGDSWNELTNFSLAPGGVLVHKTEWKSAPRLEK